MMMKINLLEIFLSSYFKIEPDEIIEVLRKEGKIYYTGE